MVKSKGLMLYEKFESINVHSEEDLEALVDLFREALEYGYGIMLKLRDVQDDYENKIKSGFFKFDDLKKIKAIREDIEKLQEERKRIEYLVKGIDCKISNSVYHPCKSFSVKAGKYIIRFDSGVMVEITNQN